MMKAAPRPRRKESEKPPLRSSCVPPEFFQNCGSNAFRQHPVVFTQNPHGSMRQDPLRPAEMKHALVRVPDQQIIDNPSEPARMLTVLDRHQQFVFRLMQKQVRIERVQKARVDDRRAHPFRPQKRGGSKCGRQYTPVRPD